MPRRFTLEIGQRRARCDVEIWRCKEGCERRANFEAMLERSGRLRGAELGVALVTWNDEQLLRGGRHISVRRPDQP